MINSIYNTDDLILKITECAEMVYSKLGYGFPKNIYSKAMTIELGFSRVYNTPNKRVTIKYRSFDLGEDIIDLVIEGQIAVIITSGDITEKNFQYLSSLIHFSGLTEGIVIGFDIDSVVSKRVHRLPMNIE